VSKIVLGGGLNLPFFLMNFPDDLPFFVGDAYEKHAQTILSVAQPDLPDAYSPGRPSKRLRIDPNSNRTQRTELVR
jgi:hypothetical protein